MSEWQPIETAPKDGRLIALYDDRVVVGCWNPTLGDGWYFWDGSDGELNCWIPGYGPSHWMPLPAPPVTSE